MRISGAVWAYAVSAAVLFAVAVPVTWERGRDSFPQSPYPMFSRKREPVITLHYVVGLGGDQRASMPPEFIANEEPILAKVTVRRAVRAGRKRTRALCAAVAARVAQRDDYAWVEHVAVMTGRFDAIAYLGGEQMPLSERRRARCRVVRGQRT